MQPYNLIEELVKKQLAMQITSYPNVCKCEQCQSDILALALNQIPPQYVTGSRNIDVTRNMIAAKYNDRILKAITNALNQVMKNPRPNCKNVKSNLWGASPKPDFFI